MFQNLRRDNQVFIFHKDGEPKLEVGTVVNVSAPIPKYQVPPMFGQPQEMVVDLTVKVGNQEVNYQKLPAGAEIADFGTSGIVISDNREAMNAEVLSHKKRSEDTLASIDYHKRVIAGCESILTELNPEYAERRAQGEEIALLKSQMAELMKMNKDLMSRLEPGASA